MAAGTLTLVLVALPAVVLLAGVLIYNRLVARKQQTEEGWSGIDVQLKRRANLIPNLIETVKGYATHERELLERITQARARAAQAEAQGAPEARAAAEADMSAGLFRLFAVAENYPDLKANQNFVQLQASLEEIEAHIQMARRYYNGSVRNLNTLIGQFPSNIVAGMFGFRTASYFEIEDPRDRALPEVRF
jgi:LemA protein